jgi:hypothetical protein
LNWIFVGIGLVLVWLSFEKFPLAPMGVIAPGSAHARPSARPPIDTSGYFPAPVSAEWPSAFKTVKILFLLESSYFCYLGAHAKIWNPTTTPSGVLAKAVTRKQEQEKKNM